MSDHKRGCPGREYVCTCGYDDQFGWQPIETAPKFELLLFFPAEKTARGDYTHAEMIRVDRYPVSYPRKPTHWMFLPERPK